MGRKRAASLTRHAALVLQHLTPARLAALSLLLLALLAACGGSEGAPAATATPAPASAICSPARPHPPGSSSATITSAGAERSYLLEVPSSYTGAEALPLVFNFHGFGSTAAEQALYSGFPAKGNAEGFFVVTPQGSGDPAFWNSPGNMLLADDVTFVAELLDELEAQLCIDSHRVYATGISNGAAMSIRLACRLPERIAAVSGVAGVFLPRSCGPISVLSFHGTADPVVPYNGGPITAGLSLRYNLEAPPVGQAMGQWSTQNGCTGAVSEQVTEHVMHLVYMNCPSGIAVELYRIEGGGHTWPGAAIDVPLLGETTREINATDLIWDFFVAHPLP